MPKFRQGTADGPLLPAPLGSSLGIPRRKARTWGATLLHAAPVLLVTLVLFPAMLAVRMNVLQQNQGKSSDGGQQGQDTARPLGPRHTEALQRRLDEIIKEATQVAREQGIVTETDAAEEERILAEQEVEDWSHLLRNNNNNGGAGNSGNKDDDASLSDKAACTNTPSDCSPHGVCLQGRCRCVAAFTGRVCGHGIWLSSPFLQSSKNKNNMKATVNIGYEGEFVVQKEGSELLHNVYGSCAVVGPANSLLLWQHGAAIDKHDVVIRVGSSSGLVTEELAAHVGRSTAVKVLDSDIATFQGGLEGEESLEASGIIILRPGVDLLPENSLPKQKYVVLSSPSFEELVAAVGPEGGAPSAVSFSTIMALNMCRSVTLYGVAPTHGILGLGGGTLLDPCIPLPSSLEKEYKAIHGLVCAGLASFGEQCVEECSYVVAADDGNAVCSKCIGQHGGKIPERLERLSRCAIDS